MTYSEIAAELPHLSRAERLALLELIEESLSEGQEGAEVTLLDLEGVGAELWQGVDAQTYVNALRSEWDERP